MQLTGKQIVINNIIQGIGEPEIQIQQQGVDLRLDTVYEFSELTNAGYICKSNKGNRIPAPNLVNPIKIDGKDMYRLKPGYYEVYFEESCKIPSNVSLHYKTRSTLIRSGAVIHSGQFDAGFTTDKMGAFLHVIHPNGIIIEKGARVCQAICFESEDVEKEKLYGALGTSQYQNK